MQDKGEAAVENCRQGLELLGSGISKPLPRAIPYRPTLSFPLGLSQLPSRGGARQEAEMELGSLCSAPRGLLLLRDPTSLTITLSQLWM